MSFNVIKMNRIQLFNFLKRFSRTITSETCCNRTIVTSLRSPKQPINTFNRISFVPSRKLHDNEDDYESSMIDDYSDDEVDFKLLTKGDPELERKVKVIQLEIENLRYEGEKVPSVISHKDWEELLLLKGYYPRKEYLSYVFKNEMAVGKKYRKKEKAKAKNLDLIMEANLRDHIQYGLGKNALFFRIYERSIDYLLNERLYSAMFFSNNVVIDFSYEKFMSRREIRNCAKQIVILFAQNRLHKSPLNLHFCNMNMDDSLSQVVTSSFVRLHEDDFPVNVHKKSYLDIFPKNQLVYLSPNASEELLEYDPNAVYIIGAYVDKAQGQPASLARAKSERLKTMKLPLDRYLKWKSGTKSLPLNVVMDILLDLNYYKDIEVALNHVPRRNLAPECRAPVQRLKNLTQALFEDEDEVDIENESDVKKDSKAL